MTNRQILISFQTEPRFKKMVSIICRRHSFVSNDIFCETLLTISEKINQNKIDLISIPKDRLDTYFCSIAWLTYKSNSNQKKYNYGYNSPIIQNSEVYEAVLNLDTLQYQNDYNYEFWLESQLEKKTTDTMEDDYNKNLFKLYRETPSYRKLAKKTKIPFITLAKDLQKYKLKLAEKFKQDHL